MTHKQFFSWLDGYLCDKTLLNNNEINRIQEKMKEVNDEVSSIGLSDDNRVDIRLFQPPPVPISPRFNEDDLGKPPKIVM